MILAGTIDPRKKLVFVDEMRSNTSLSPQYAYSPKGRRAYAKVLRNHGRTLRCLRVRAWRGARFVPGVEGYTAATASEAYVEKSVRVGLRRGQSVALDNLGAHKNERPGS